MSLFPSEAVSDLERLLRREWLETNARGSYAAGTALDCHTRKYHGALVVPAPPSLEASRRRWVALSKTDDCLVDPQARELHLSTNKYPQGVYHPVGWQYLKRFEDTPCPSWEFASEGWALKRSLMMVEGETAVYVRYDFEATSSRPWTLRVRPLLAFRDFHDLTRENLSLRPRTFAEASGFKISPYEGMDSLHCAMRMVSPGKTEPAFYPAPEWIHHVEYAREQERGYAYQEDLFAPGAFEISLRSGESVILRCGTAAPEGAHSLGERWAGEEARRAERAAGDVARVTGASPRTRRLTRLAGQFLFRGERGETRLSVAFPWLFESSREMAWMVPGLTASGYVEESGEALARLGDAIHPRTGLIPSHLGGLPEGGGASYHDADTFLWWVWAVHQWTQITGNVARARKEFLPLIRRGLDAVLESRCPLLAVMPNGLLSVPSSRAGLTWMNASVGGMAVVPRCGALVEVNALWHHALSFAMQLARETSGEDVISAPDDRWIAAARASREAFLSEFWLSEEGFLADAVTDEGPDRAMRPNQLVAAALAFSPLPSRESKLVLAVVEKHLLTPVGIRTLSPKDSRYRPIMSGDQISRDVAMHQGAAWPWMLGLFVDAALRSAGDRMDEISRLRGLLGGLYADTSVEDFGGLCPEMFHASAPHVPDGCFAHGPAVTEVSRVAWLLRGER